MIIQSSKVWIDYTFQPAQLVIEGDKIKQILPYQEEAVDYDYQDNWILPGFIDIHDHGYDGGDANNADPQHIRKWRKYLPSEGVTSFLPTTSTETFEKLEKAFVVLRHEIENPTVGARIIGIHVEGPFLSHEKRGAHNPYLIAKPDIEVFNHWQALSGNNIKMVAVAPENDINQEFTKAVTKEGVLVCIAHSNGSYEDGKQAIAAGANNMTHLFNAMSQLGHRSPGIVGAGLAHEEVYAELICDGVHVDFAAGKIACLAKGKKHLIAITDAVRLKGLAPGVYRRPDSNYVVTVSEEGVARLQDGRLAGSTNKMNTMAYNLVNKMDQTVEFAIRACTSNPARFLKVDDHLGHIKANYLADLVITDDKFNVLTTFVSGEKVFGE